MLNSKITLLYVLSVIWLVIFTHSLQAQTDVTSAYLSAKSYLQQEKFDLAYKQFSELRNGIPYTDFWAYCSYYAAYCSYKLNKVKDANFLLFQIVKEYPQWHAIQKAYYLKGVVQMQNKQYVDAFLQWDKVSESALEKHTFNAKQHFLAQFSPDSLEWLSQKLPKDKAIKNIQNKSISLTVSNLPIPLVNNRLDVAVMLPVELMAKNSFLYEFYTGILMANDSLQRAGVPVQFHFFDSGRDSTTLWQLLAAGGFDGFDLIIGPIYAEQQKLINDYAFTHQIPVVNPLSHQQPADTKNNPYYFMNMPSYENMGEAAAEFSLQNFNRKNNAIIVYGTALGDSAMAAAYKSKYESLGGKVLLFRQLSKNTASYFSTLIKKIPPDSLGHVFVSGAEPSLAAHVFTGLESALLEKAAAYKETLLQKLNEEEKKSAENGEEPKKITVQDVPVITLPRWMQYTSITFDQLQLHNTHFVYPDYVQTNHNVSIFSKKYAHLYGIDPTRFSYIGYETGIYFSSLVYKYGNYLRNYLNTALVDCNAFMGCKNYNFSVSNRYVPVIQFNDYDLKWANRPQENE